MKKSILVLLLSFISCQKEDTSMFDVVFSNQPIIKSATIEPKTINLDSILIGGEKKPEDTILVKFKATAIVYDIDGFNDIATVNLEVINPIKNLTLTRGDLQKINDSTFTLQTSFNVQRKDDGNYYVKFSARDKSNLPSNEIYLSLKLYRGNRPPFISDLKAPDTVFVQDQTTLIKITIKATDPDGIEDIKTVQFNSFKPDGTPSSGNPFKMYDDGNLSGISGDDIAGDGIYSIIIQLPPNTQKGKYRFEFQAIDKSNASSNILTHYIYVL
jgi:hypothetical protein